MNARLNAATFIGWWLNVIVVVVALPLLGEQPAFGEDRMVLGPRQFEFDKGAGAVLCTWSIYLSIRAERAACGAARLPVDDAIDEAIAAMDDFILANSSLHPTRSMLEDFKRRAAESELRAMSRRDLQEYCGRHEFKESRSIILERIGAEMKALLAVPREPVMNPCL